MMDSAPKKPYSDDDSHAVSHQDDGLPEDLSQFAEANLPRWKEAMARVESSRDRFQMWLEYLLADPSPVSFRDHAQDLLDDLRLALGKQGAERAVIDVIDLSGELFERVGMGHQLYKLLIALYGEIVESEDQEHVASLFRWITRYHLQHGDPQRAKITLDLFQSLVKRDPDLPLSEAMLDEVSIAAMMDSSGDGPALSAALLKFALDTRARYIMGKAFCTLAKYYCYRFDVPRTFQYGQLTLFIGQKLGEPVFIATGLHYMAIAFTIDPNPQGTNPARAIALLDQAEAQCRASGDLGRLPVIAYTRGNCYYLLRDYDRAVEHLSFALTAFPPDTTFYARTGYMIGLSLARLNRFDEAERWLHRVYDLWGTLKMPRDQIYAAHALAFTYFQNGQLAEAVKMGQHALAAAAQLTDDWWQGYLTELTADVRKYEQALAVSRA